MSLAIYTFPFADGGNYGKEGAQTTPLRVEEPAEQVLIYGGIIPTLDGWGRISLSFLTSLYNSAAHLLVTPGNC